MKRFLIAISVTAVTLFNSSVNAYVDFNDGGHHIINYTINDYVNVDLYTPGVGTQVELVNGGYIEFDILAHEDCQISVSGGQLAGSLRAYDNTYAVVSEGQVGSYITAFDNSNVFFTGGSCSTLAAYNEGCLTVSGGVIDDIIYAGRSFAIWDASLITFEGTSFAINGQPVTYGDFASDYATAGSGYLYGTLTGTLTNGDTLNNVFNIYDDSDITFVPEPSTLLLLGLGAVMLRRKRN